MTTPLRRQRRIRWTLAALAAYMVGISAVGVAGMVEPAYAWTVLDHNDLLAAAYSVVMIASGGVGVVAVVRRQPDALRVVLLVLAGATALHGIVALTGGQVQAGVRLLIAPFAMVPAAYALAFRLAMDLRLDDGLPDREEE